MIITLDLWTLFYCTVCTVFVSSATIYTWEYWKQQKANQTKQKYVNVFSNVASSVLQTCLLKEGLDSISCHIKQIEKKDFKNLGSLLDDPEFKQGVTNIIQNFIKA